MLLFWLWADLIDAGLAKFTFLIYLNIENEFTFYCFQLCLAPVLKELFSFCLTATFKILPYLLIL